MTDTVLHIRDDDRPLELDWAAVRTALAAGPLPVFATLPEGRGMPYAVWPADGEGSWREFLDIAHRAGAAVVYAQALRFAGEDEPSDALVRVRHRNLAEQFPERVGLLGALELAFAAGGVMHGWFREASWWDEVAGASLSQSEDDDFGAGESTRRVRFGPTPEGKADLEAAFGAAKLEEAITALVTSPNALATSTGRGDLTLAATALTSDWVAYPGDEPADEDWQAAMRREAARYLGDAVVRRIPAERAQRIQAARDGLHELISELISWPEYQDATTAELRRQRIRGFVAERIGFPSKELVEELYAKAPKPAPRGSRLY